LESRKASKDCQEKGAKEAKKLTGNTMRKAGERDGHARGRGPMTHFMGIARTPGWGLILEETWPRYDGLYATGRVISASYDRPSNGACVPVV